MTKNRPALEEILERTRIEGPRAVLDMHLRLQVDEAEFLANTLQKEGIRIEPFDFPRTIAIWQTQNANGVPYKRLATKQFIKKLAENRGVDYRTFEGFKALLEDLIYNNFCQVPINEWETTLSGMLGNAYQRSPCAAVLDLVNSDDEFAEIRAHNLQAYDFQQSPKNTWKDKNGRPTEICRTATKQLIKVLAKSKGVDYKTFKGFKTLLEDLTADNFRQVPINEWETTLRGMLAVYQDSPCAAVLDLVNSDDEFAEIRAHNLQAYDFSRSPMNTWKDKNGKPTETCRTATKQLIKVLAKSKGVDYKTFKGFKTLLEDLTHDNFFHAPINEWETTLHGMLTQAYQQNPCAAVLDLIRHDPEFKRLRGKITADSLRGSTTTRESRLEGNYSTQVLKRVLSNNGIDLSEYGFFTFAKGEKQSVRELLAEEAREHFGDKPIAYFGLEGPAFGSYFALAHNVKIDAKNSLIPEKNRRNYNVMNRIKRIKRIKEILNGSAPSGLELFVGTAEKALSTTNQLFDLIFLDWLGHLSPQGIRELELAYKHIPTRGMIACTVNMSGMSQRRYHDQTGLSVSPDKFMHNWARERGMSCVDIDYVGGDKVKTPMRLYIFK